MSTLVRWNPVREMLSLRDAVDRMFEDTFDFPSFRWPEAKMWSVALDVIEDGDNYIVKASLPGLNPEDIDVTVNDNILTIKGEVEGENLVHEEQYHVRERRFGSFMRSVTLPTLINADKIEAVYAKGVLELRIPKAEEVKPKRIAIKSDGHKVITAKANK
ncbi:MAG: Hsp20/alpha crystallin family protein [Anaerolineales bacterium]|nr:Hsp20/alpha crystallin family protein [Anaerolineales bacterium]MCB8951730.1 Hsp20/alpha crystallin family protein [Ardenticatenales bacterium]